jgi:hypothetical protein
MKRITNLENTRARRAKKRTEYLKAPPSGFRVSDKGLVQIDFIIAAALFIIVFALVVQLINTFFTTAEGTAEINTLTSQATSLLSVADFSYVPSDWTGSGDVDRIGFFSRAYRFYIAVDNSQTFYLNQSQSVTDLTNELVSFLYSDIGFTNIDVNSTEIYLDGSRVPYNINGYNITFRTDIAANTKKIFTVYFDDDSNFTSRSVTINGNNTITETVHFVQPIPVIQYRKLQTINASNYSAVRDSLGIDDFNIVLQDIDTNPVSTFFSYGGEVPRSGNVIAMQRNHVYQNSTAGIRNGRLIVKTW